MEQKQARTTRKVPMEVLSLGLSRYVHYGMNDFCLIAHRSHCPYTGSRELFYPFENVGLHGEMPPSGEETTCDDILPMCPMFG